MKNIVGYQVINLDTKEYPEDFYSFEILTQAVAEAVITDFKNKGEMNWVLMVIHEGEIEEPTFVDHL